MNQQLLESEASAQKLREAKFARSTSWISYGRWNRGYSMKADTIRSGDDRETRQVQDNQKKLAAARQMLFDLLEEYAPRWYTQQHRDKAIAALAGMETRRP